MTKTAPLILASGSSTRQAMLQAAGIPYRAVPARIDEENVKRALLAEAATPRDIADTLADMKARRISEKDPDATVLGADQVLALGKTILSKPDSPVDAIAQLRELRSQAHQLLSAAVLYEEGKPVWRHVGVVRLQMRPLSDGYIDSYVARNWDSIRHSVGGYKIEEEGVRLFSRIDGSHFAVLGLPLIELITFLTARGTLPQ